MLASTSTSIAWLVLLVSVGGWILYGIFNIRKGRTEVGAEQKLAANRRPYYDDEDLEGPRLERVQDVRVGKHISLQIEAANEAAAREVAENASKKLLANAVMEYFEIEFIQA